ncbi:MAG: hypothetical protein LBQ56_04320 [Synergistaceae bacterium]|jgi:hypothetical protein|nr:hypothetical protein [Synergistaceae bacterium]
MKRVLRIMAMVVLFAASFAVTAWSLAPWTEAGIYVMDVIRLQAARRGVFITHQDIEKSGYLTPIYRVNSLEAENPLVRASMSNVMIRILPLSSLLAFGGSCQVQFGDSEFDLMTGDSLNVDGGAARLTASGNLLIASDVQVKGDVGATGGIVYNLSSGGIVGSTILLRVPKNLDGMLSSPFLSPYVEPGGPGEWRIKQNATPDR